MSSKRLTALFVPMVYSGHISMSLCLAKELAAKGYRIIFATEKSFYNRFAAHGYEEEVYEALFVQDSGDVKTLKDCDDEFNDENLHFYKKISIFERIEFVANLYKWFSTWIRDTNSIIGAIIKKTKPDLILANNLQIHPCIETSGVPYIWLCACNPLILPVDEHLLPPVFSGLSTKQQTEWAKFLQIRNGYLADSWEEYNKWIISNHGLPKKPFQYVTPSKYLNIYLYPEDIDYTDVRPLDSTFVRMNAAIRDEVDDLNIPQDFLNLPGKLIYLSLGSIGSGDHILMQRLTTMLAVSKNKFIVSKGTSHDKYELPDNMWGKPFLPQLKVLEKVDLFITHGGNNSLTEGIYFGKPLIVLYMFADQLDNGTRIQEKNIGYTFSAYNVIQDELVRSIDDVLKNRELASRMEQIARKVRSAKSAYKDIADLIHDKIMKI